MCVGSEPPFSKENFGEIYKKFINDLFDFRDNENRLFNEVMEDMGKAAV